MSTPNPDSGSPGTEKVESVPRSEWINSAHSEVPPQPELGNRPRTSSQSQDIEAGISNQPEEDQRDESRQQDVDEPPYSIFGKHEKHYIIALASLAALFSPLSANIYFPALNTLSHDLNVSLDKINLTITTYLVGHSNLYSRFCAKTAQIFQGLAPSFIGSLSDDAGRRPSYIICFIIYLGANIGLAELKNYPSLLVLRMLQSSGSSGTYALVNGVVSDIATSAGRGTALGYAQMGALVGPAVGPIIGGMLNKFLGWRSIFWFLTIFAGATFLLVLVTLPETCRKVVGNGSISTGKWNMSLLSYLHQRRQRKAGVEVEQTARLRVKARFNPLTAVYILLQKETGIVIFYSGLLFSGLYMVFSSIPPQFEEKYGFNTLQIGLCYIPTGLGAMLSAIVVGKLLNWNFRRHAKILGMEIVDRKQQDLTNFPIEAARLQVVLPLVYLAAATTVAYGWVMRYHTNLAGPIILLFISTFCTIGSFTGTSALVVDLNRTSAGTVTAAMNLARCWMGAGAVAFVNPMLKAIGLGWTSVVVAAVWVCMSPVVLVVMKLGPRWRKEKRLADEKKVEEEAATEQARAGNEDGAPTEKT